MDTHAPAQLRSLMSEVTTVIFDFNGTLSDDETELEAAYGSALLDMGLTEMNAAEYAGLLGRSEPDIAHALVQARGLGETEATILLEKVGQQYAQLCQANPRVSATSVGMVKQLATGGWKQSIVTGTLRQLITPVLVERGIIDYFHTVLTIEDVTAGKPDPEGFNTAAALLGETNPTKVIVFEDSRAGVEAARSAGMHVVGIGPSSGANLTFESMDEVAGIIFPQLVA